MHSSDTRAAVPYSFGVSARLTTEKAALYQEAASQIASDLASRLTEWLPGFAVQAAPLIEAEAGDELADDVGAFDSAPLVMAHDDCGTVLTEHSLALTLVTGLLGGSTMAAGDPRPLTTIEQRILDLVTGTFVGAAATTVLAPEPVAVDRGRAATFAAHDEGVPEPRIGFTFDIAGPWGGGRLIIGWELWAIQRFSDVIDSRLSGRRAAAEAPSTGADVIAALHPVPVPFTVGLGHVRLAAREIVDLRPGDVIRTRTPVDDDAVASVGSIDVFTVRLGQRGQQLTAEIISPLPGIESIERRLARTDTP